MFTSYITLLSLFAIGIGIILLQMDDNIVFDRKNFIFIIEPKDKDKDKNKNEKNSMKWIYKFCYGIYMGLLSGFICVPLVILGCAPIIFIDLINELFFRK